MKTTRFLPIVCIAAGLAASGCSLWQSQDAGRRSIKSADCPAAEDESARPSEKTSKPFREEPLYIE
jgi:hypothetical protein